MTDWVEFREENYFIRGTRVSLDSIVYGHLNGDSVQAIHDSFPVVSLEQIEGGIAFYRANQATIDLYLRRKREEFEAARRSQSHISPEVRSRLEQARQSTTSRT
jgi:uncharacterized protein (DUF433 family)